MIQAYFDCFSGASGDMVVGALIDLGLSFDELRTELGRLGLHGYDVASEPVRRGGLGGTHFHVRLETEGPTREHHHPARHLRDIRRVLADSPLPGPVILKAMRVFERLAEAEAHVHRCSVEDVHFHEMGAVDTILDIVGAVWGLERLGVGEVLCSELVTGYGFVECAHGRLPVPAPATAELLKGVPSRAGTVARELLTPTGAAILTTLASGYGPRPTLQVKSIGYGAGTADLKDQPNLLRVFLGETIRPGERDRVWIVETNLDDVPGETVGFVAERLFAAGALDVYVVPIQMKKSRPGVLLSTIVDDLALERVEEILLRETSTFGVRRHAADRRKLDRQMATVETPWGPVRVKVGRMGGQAIKAAPEYEDCARLALASGVPFQNVFDMASRRAEALLPPASQG